MWVSQVFFKLMRDLLIGACLETVQTWLISGPKLKYCKELPGQAGKVSSHADVQLIICVILADSPKLHLLSLLYWKTKYVWEWWCGKDDNILS